MAAGKKTGGRQAGTPNKVSAAAKDVIAQAADEIGGLARLVEWLKADPKNEAAYWTTIYPKLLPLTVNAAVKAEILWGLPKPKVES